MFFPRLGNTDSDPNIGFRIPLQKKTTVGLENIGRHFLKAQNCNSFSLADVLIEVLIPQPEKKFKKF